MRLLLTRFAAVLFLPLLLSGCLLESVASTPAPVELADSTARDEQALLAAELAYKAARLAAETAVDAGLLKGDRAARVAQLDRQAYVTLTALRRAYDAGQAQDWVTGITRARSAVEALLAAVKGT